MKKVTIKDIAKVAGVSYATVSRALSGSSEIGEDTRQRILQISKEMGYTANHVARSLVARETKAFGLIVSGIHNPFTSELAYYLEKHARAKGYNLMLCNSDGDLELEEEVFKHLLRQQVDGVIIIPIGKMSYERLAPYLDNKPTIFVSENLRDLRENYVTIDNYKGTYMGTKYLFSLGHRNIIYFSRRIGSLTHQLRAQGYTDACEAFGIEPQYVDSHYPISTVQNGYALAANLFKSDREFTAIFASSDMSALGVLQAAEELGVRIPEDVSLLGFDNISYASLPGINLTTIDQPKNAMARVAVDLLVNLITDPTAGYSHRIMMPSLIERKTCRALSHQEQTPPSSAG